MFRQFMNVEFDAYVHTVTFGQKSPKLNISPVHWLARIILWTIDLMVFKFLAYRFALSYITSWTYQTFFFQNFFFRGFRVVYDQDELDSFF